MDLSNIFLYIAIASVITSISWLIYVSINAQKYREERRKKERDEKTKIKVDDLSEESADFIQVNIEKGTQRITVQMPKTDLVTAEQVLVATVVPKVNVSTISPKIRRANFKISEGYKKNIRNFKRRTPHIVLQKDELA